MKEEPKIRPTIKKDTDGFTPLQRNFVTQYVLCNENRTEAARRAGYTGSPSSLSHQAEDNLNKPHVIKAIEELKLRLRDEANDRPTIADAIEQQEFFTSVIRGEVKEVRVTRNGLVEVPPSISGRNAATEKLARMQGNFIEKSQVDVDNRMVIEQEVLEGLHYEAEKMLQHFKENAKKERKHLLE